MSINHERILNLRKDNINPKKDLIHSETGELNWNYFRVQPGLYWTTIDNDKLLYGI